MDKQFRCEYKLYERFGKLAHQWTIIGRHGAKHLHVSSYGSGNNIEFSGGLETHWRTPPEYMENDAPSHDECWLLKQPCWHDGTSIYVSETFLPRWEYELGSEEGFSTKDHEAIFNWLRHEMLKTWPEKG